MTEQDLTELTEKFSCSTQGFHVGSESWLLEVPPDSLYGLLEYLLREQRFWCDFLSCISAEHVQAPEELIRLHYHLESLPRGMKIQVISIQPVEDSSAKPIFPSACNLWQSASWHEREIAELFGVSFENHPDPRRLLLPADWIGYPMRKDYEAAEKYHGLNIRYERSDPEEK